MPSARSKLGAAAEGIARRRLEAEGYTLRAANYRCRWGEVDLVMERDGALVFVEVRAKRSTAFGAPEESVTAAKRRRLIATAHDYIERHGVDAEWRVDLVAIVFGARGGIERVTHLEHIATEADLEA